MIENLEPNLDAPVIAVRGNGPLSGTVVVPGAKNSVLKLMAATLLCDGTFELTNVPAIADVAIMSDLLVAIGVGIERPSPDRLLLTDHGDLTPVAPYELVERIRASINVLGPLLTRCGHVRLSMPGGAWVAIPPGLSTTITGPSSTSTPKPKSGSNIEFCCQK